MNCKTSLEFLEKNIRNYNKLEDFIKLGNEFSYNDLITDLSCGAFDECEYMIPIMMFSSEDTIIENTIKRLFIRMFNIELESAGLQKTANEIISIIKDEKKLQDCERERRKTFALSHHK